MWISQIFLCYWFLLSFHYDQKTHFVWFSFFYALWTSLRSILDIVPCAIEKNMYSAVFQCSVPKMYVRSSLFLFKSSIPLIFCLVILTIIQDGYWIIKLLLCISFSFPLCPFCQLLLHVFWGLLLDYIYIVVVFPWQIYSFIIMKSPSSCLVMFFVIKSIFYISLATPAFLWLLFAWYRHTLVLMCFTLLCFSDIACFTNWR